MAFFSKHSGWFTSAEDLDFVDLSRVRGFVTSEPEKQGAELQHLAELSSNVQQATPPVVCCLQALGSWIEAHGQLVATRARAIYQELACDDMAKVLTLTGDDVSRIAMQLLHKHGVQVETTVTTTSPFAQDTDKPLLVDETKLEHHVILIDSTSHVPILFRVHGSRRTRQVTTPSRLTARTRTIRYSS